MKSGVLYFRAGGRPSRMASVGMQLVSDKVREVISSARVHLKNMISYPKLPQLPVTSQS